VVLLHVSLSLSILGPVHSTLDKPSTSYYPTTNTLFHSLTAEGLDYLREWLHLPAEIVPQTHIKQQRSHAPPRGMLGGEERPRGGRGGPRGDRERGEYRRRDAGEGKEGAAPGEFNPQFRGGFGRGRGAAAPAPSS
jgi:small subunit ribosomal protein S10e